MTSKGPKEEGTKAAEAARKPAIQIPKIQPATNGALRGGLIGFGIAAICGAGAYYYFNYMKKPQPKPLYEPSAQTKQDAKNFMDATSRLIADFSKQTKAIVEAGNNLSTQLKREGQHLIATTNEAVTNIKKEGEKTVNAFNKTYHDIKSQGEAMANVASKSANEIKTQTQNINSQLSQAAGSVKKESRGFFSWGSDKK